jgi:hypothetical protein
MHIPYNHGESIMRNPLIASLLAASFFALGTAGTFAAEGGTLKTGKKAEFGRAAEADTVKSGRKAEFGRAAEGESIKVGRKNQFGREAEGDTIRAGKKAEFGRAADAGGATTTK